MADWSMLPCDILGEIALKLDTIDEFIYFSTVCHSWNHASSIVKCERNATKLMPWLLLAEPENTKQNPSHLRKIYNLNNNKCYQLSMPETYGARCWGSSYGLVVVLTTNYQVHLFNPLTKERLTNLPSIQHLPKHKKHKYDPFLNLEADIYWRYYVHSFVVLKRPQSNDLLVAVIYDEIYNCLAVARPGDQSWTYINDDVETVGSSGEFFYMVCPYGKLRYCDFRRIFDLEPVKVMDYVPAIRTIWISSDKIYLLSLGDDLIMVVRAKNEYEDEVEVEDYLYEIVEGEDGEEYEIPEEILPPYYWTRKFDVFKVDSTNKKWVKVDDVGNFSIFVGCNSAMSISVPNGCNLRRNCIYFTDDDKAIWTRMPEYSGYDMGIYDIKTRDAKKIYEGDGVGSLFCPPFLFVPNC